MSSRYAEADVYTESPYLDDTGQWQDDTPKSEQKTKYKWLRSSIDLWEVMEVRAGWTDGTVDLIYFNTEVNIVKGHYEDWFEKHKASKEEQLIFSRKHHKN